MQTSYSDHPALGRAGMLADAGPKLVHSRLATNRLNAGRGVFRVPGYGAPGSNTSEPGQVYNVTSAAIAVDVDAILSGGASAASIQTILSASLNGVVGSAEMFPARQITLVLSSHADWDATTAVLTFVNHLGVTVAENLAIPNGGNATVTSVGYARNVVSLVIPAQSGTGGTFTVGITVLDTVTIADYVGIALYDAAHEPFDTIGSDAAEYADGDAVPVIVTGSVWVVTEDACSEGDDVYTRIGGSGSLGAFRNDADSASCVQIVGARYGRSSAAGAINIVHLL